MACGDGCNSGQILLGTTLFVFLILLGSGCYSEDGLTWKDEGHYEWAKVSPGYWGSVGFEKKASTRTGVTFENTLDGEEIADNRVLTNGSGVAAGDVDGDGLVDLYFAQLDGSNALYKNMGDMRFKDITDSSGVGHTNHYSTGVTFADIDGDGDLDLVVATLDGGNQIYINDGGGKFAKKENNSINGGRGSSTLSLADIDGDGDLDLFVSNYKRKNISDSLSPGKTRAETILKKEEDSLFVRSEFKRDFELFFDGNKPNARQVGRKNELYINDGTGDFREVEDYKSRFQSKTGEPMGLDKNWTLTAKFRDINGDMLPDLYVCNDFWTKDRIWINKGDGTFKNLSTPEIMKTSYSSMGVDFLDVNRDSHLDIFTTEMLSFTHRKRIQQKINTTPFASRAGTGDQQRQYVQNALLLNRGDNTFAEIGYYAGVEATDWSWATTSMDVNLDGYEDIIVNTGNAYDFRDLDTPQKLGRKASRGTITDTFLLEYPELRLKNIALENKKDTTFERKSTEWGFTENDVSHGLATADLDNDGDLDLVTNRLNQTAAIYENTSTKPRIAVRLKGKAPNTQGIGAKVELRGGPVRQRTEVVAGGDYASGSDPLVVFAATADNHNHTLIVNWPSGAQTRIEGVRANRIYRVSESNATSPNPSDEGDRQVEKHQFREASSRIDHVHHEDPFDDFRLQPLLPLKLSQLGPGVSWIDVNQDGHDDLFVSGGKGGTMGVFLNDGDGTFSRIKGAEDLTAPTAGDQTAIVGWADEYGQHIVVGQSNYEQGSASVPSAVHYTFEEGKRTRKEPIPGIHTTTGPLAGADYDGDGDVDLFLGGRFRPIRYPRDVRSRLFRYEGGGFELDRGNSRQLKELGLVTGAVFSDIDRDGDQDLVLSREWDSILLLENNEGRFTDITSEVGLSKFTGRWNGVTTGDVNNDGRPDIIATNWGLNSIYQTDSNEPLKVYYDDFDLDKKVEIIESYFDKQSGSYVPRRQLYDLNESLPEITRNIITHEQYSRMSVGKVIGMNTANIPSKEINTTKHTIFINRGGHFTAHPLPSPTQLTTAFDPEIADFDNDGNEDIFLSQNFFAQPLMTPRQDAGRGVLLKGDGRGNFTVIPGQVSGIQIYGEQRGAAASDFNGDGRVDLAVSQNQAPTKLYVNHTEKRGLRIHLQGPEQNLDAIGSSLRLVYQDGRKGPRREIQAGSGYRSQSSSTQVMGVSGTPVELQVEWFDGTTQTVQVPEGDGPGHAQAIEVDHPDRSR
ncbi:MAG: FG-GAP-like repeat-containing protein [Salinibacter sp.]